MLSPLLWLLVVDTILSQLTQDGTKVVAHAHDIVTGKYPNILSELLTFSLKILSDWCDYSGLEVNQSKTALVMFTRKLQILRSNIEPKVAMEIKLKRTMEESLRRKLGWLHTFPGKK